MGLGQVPVEMEICVHVYTTKRQSPASTGLSLRFSEDGLSEIVAGQKSSSSFCSCYVLLIFRLRVAG